MRVQLLKRQLEQRGHTCAVLNIGQSRRIPSDEYETVMSAFDYLRKVCVFSARGYVAHVHVNGASVQGFALALIAEIVSLLCGRRCVLTFHAGTDQIYFPRPKYPWLLPMFWVLFTIPQRIICNSEAVKARICEYGIPSKKISAIQAFSTQYLEFERRPLEPALDRFYARFPVLLFSYVNLRPKFHPVELLDGFAQVARRRSDVGLVLCGVGGYPELDLRLAVQARLEREDLAGRVLMVDDLDHDDFLNALSRATVFVRSHVSDGVCSSVLEALALRVPVVASENGQRPAGVVTYRATDADELATRLEEVIERRDAIASTMPQPEIPDTLTEEADLLVGIELPSSRQPGARTCAA
jgi:glycosyltransferase involved in cell wall biosynthesis